MHTVTVTTKRKADAISMESLFTSGGTVTRKSRYDKGKYGNNLVGREAQVPDDVVALYTERRKDKDGPYYALFCLSR